MEVKLSDEAAAIIAREVEEGRYRTAEEAVEAAVWLLCDEIDVDAAIERHRTEIEEGIAEIERGEARELPAAFFDDLRERIRQRESA